MFVCGQVTGLGEVFFLLEQAKKITIYTVWTITTAVTCTLCMSDLEMSEKKSTGKLLSRLLLLAFTEGSANVWT